MLRITFLGHQGWMLSTSRVNLLVDPQLSVRMGTHPRVAEMIYPPRSFDVGSLPPVDAVLITHEHADHFSLPTLNLLSRRIPIHLSALSSHAARAILAEMGFRVRLVRPGEPWRVGDLELVPFAADHRQDPGDEWDAMPFLARDREGASFFTLVDIPPSPALLKSVFALEPRVSVFGVTLNSGYGAWALLGDTVRPPRPSASSMAAGLIQFMRFVGHQWSPPQAFLGSGAGFYFDGELSWLNENLFVSDPFRVQEQVTLLDPDLPFLAPTPGQSLQLERGAIVEMLASSPGVEVADRAAWPSREFRDSCPRLLEYGPCGGRRVLSGQELAEIESRLSELAAYLYGRPLFRSLLSLRPEEREGRRPTLLLSLLDDRRKRAFAYDPRGGTFREVEARDEISRYLMGFECWGTDFAELLRGELMPYCLSSGRYRFWCTPVPGKIEHFDFWEDIVNFFHPLRRPRAYLDYYRGVVAREAAPSRRVRGPGEGAG